MLGGGPHALAMLLAYFVCQNANEKGGAKGKVSKREKVEDVASPQVLEKGFQYAASYFGRGFP